MSKTPTIRAPAKADTNDSERDRWFNPSLRAIDRLCEVTVIVMDAVEKHRRRRKLKEAEWRSLTDTLERVVANLVHHHLSGGRGGIIVPRSKKVLGVKPTRYQAFSFPKPFPKWLDALEALGFAQESVGGYSHITRRSRRTTIRAGAKLIELIEEHKVNLANIRADDLAEVIILSRSKNGFWDDSVRIINYQDTPVTERYRSELRAINAWLAKADIQFDATAHNKPVDVGARQLRRRFTSGHFESGGRLFGGFWEGLSKTARSQGIRIDGEAVVSLDYSQLNPVLCYSVVEAEPPADDAYTLPGLEQYRAGVKRVFNAMLFHYPVTKFPKREPGELKEAKTLFPKGFKCGGVVAMILHYHPKLKDVLSSGNIGHHLQFLESQIMMRVLNCCRQRNIVALPVFDCVVVRGSAQGTVKEIMQREFKAVSGVDITVKLELAEQAGVALEIDPRSGL